MQTTIEERMSMFDHIEGVNVEPEGSWLWITGDTYPHRAYFKAHGCKWSKKRRAWYQTGDREERETDPIAEVFTTTASEGYMGAVKLTGSKSHLSLYGSDLSKAVRDDLRNYIVHPSIRRSDINVSSDVYSMGQSICITVKLDRAVWAVSRDEFMRAALADPWAFIHIANWIYYRDENGDEQCIWGEKAEFTPEFIENVLTLMYDKFERRDRLDINQYHIDREIMLTDDCIQMLKDVNKIVCSYRYDDSNSMVDYFDTNFYYDIRIKWK